MPKIFKNPRQVVYSYLLPKELLKVVSLSKRERETVLTSRTVKENRNEDEFILFFNVYDFDNYSTDIAV
jgi:hypothetical protein